MNNFPYSPREAVSGIMVLWFSDGRCLRFPAEFCDPMCALVSVAEWFFGRLDAVSVSFWMRSSANGGCLVRFAHKSRAARL